MISRLKRTLYPPKGSFSYRYQNFPAGPMSTVHYLAWQDRAIESHCLFEGAEYHGWSDE